MLSPTHSRLSPTATHISGLQRDRANRNLMLIATISTLAVAVISGAVSATIFGITAFVVYGVYSLLHRLNTITVVRTPANHNNPFFGQKKSVSISQPTILLGYTEQSDGARMQSTPRPASQEPGAPDIRIDSNPLNPGQISPTTPTYQPNRGQMGSATDIPISRLVFPPMPSPLIPPSQNPGLNEQEGIQGEKGSEPQNQNIGEAPQLLPREMENSSQKDAEIGRSNMQIPKTRPKYFFGNNRNFFLPNPMSRSFQPHCLKRSKEETETSKKIHYGPVSDSELRDKFEARRKKLPPIDITDLPKSAKEIREWKISIPKPHSFDNK